MKLFLIGIGHLRPEQIEVARKLKRDHEIKYWVRMDHIFQINEGEFPGTVFHSYQDALKGIPASGVSSNDFDPPSAALIHALSDTEAEMMVMMNKWYPAWGVPQRKDFYYELIRYWNGVLDAFAPDCIVFLEIPHELYSFVLFALAKRRKIRTLMFEDILRFDRIVIEEDYRVGSEAILSAHKQGFPIATRVEDLDERLRTYYLEQTGGSIEVPRYIGEIKHAYRGFSYWMRRIRSLKPFIRDGSIYRRATSRLLKMIEPNLRSEYAAVVQEADFDKPYIYFGLHFQPERTSCPQAGVYADQLLLIRTLAAALPEGWEIYVKEHPVQWAPTGGDYTQDRYPGYYRSIAQIPNTRLVKTETDSYKLIHHARAIAAGTGTIGWEAVLRGKPAFVFGYAWYKYAPGVFRVESEDECRSAIAAVQKGFSIDPQAVLNYLGYLERESVPCFFDEYKRSIAGVTDEESAQNMYRLLDKALATIT